MLISNVPIDAQVVRGAVLLPDSVTPVTGVIVVATDDRGATAVRALTGARGDFVLKLPAEGRYFLRVLRIGFRPAPGPSVMVGAASIEQVRIIYSAAPVMLSSMNVRERETCRVSADTGLMVARVWDEARKAMLSSQLSADSAPLVADWIEYDRRLDSAARVIHDQRIRSVRHPTTHAFRSVSAAVLDSAGYVVADTDGTTYYAPDAEVLLSDRFVAGHCFRLDAAAPGRGRDSNLIGVAFQPSRERRDLPEIQGTLWVDLASSELRTLEFTYTNLPAAAAIAGGRVEFLRLADGHWLVSRWSLRMPRLGAAPRTGDDGLRRVIVSGTQSVLRGVQVSGGEVTRVMRGDSLVYAASGPAITAQVVARDGLLPVGGATVALEGTDYTATADGSGRIRLSPVLAGRYRAHLSTPLMDSLGIPAVVHEVEAREDAHVDSLMLPPTSDILRAVCPRDSARDGEAMLRGRVQDGRAEPLSQAAVTVTWTSDAERTIGALTDVGGYWRVCGVPRETPLSVQVVADSGSDTRRTRLGQSDALGAVDLVLHRDSSTPGATSSRALVELVVNTINGAPLPEATLEVQTPGGQSRTVVSGPAGRALVPDVTPGLLTVRAKRIGFKPGQLAVTVEPGRNTVPIILSDVSMPTLDTVRVIGGRRAWGRFDEFETRRLNHQATVSIARADIEKRNPVDIWQLLRGIPSIEIRDLDTMIVATSARTKRAGLLDAKPCYLTIMVDGTIKTATPGTDAYDLRDLPVPEAIYGVEVFAGAASMPLQYGGTGTGKMCGMIALWTR